MKLRTLASIGFLASAQALLAVNYTWNANSGSGGTGTWDATATNWLGSPTWTGGTDDDAVFSGTAGTVTVSGSVSVNDITFNTSDYLINTSGSSDRLIFNGGATPTVTITSGSATIQAPIGGTLGLTKSGAGTLVIEKVYTIAASGGNTLSGTVAVNGGTLVVKDTSADGPNVGYAFNNVSSFLIDTGTMSLQGTQNALTTSPKPVTIQNGGVLSGDRVGGGGHRLGAVTLNGGNLLTTNANSFLTAGPLTVGGAAISTIGAPVDLFAGARTFDVADAVSGTSTDLLVSGVVSNGGITKTGVGTMTLTGANTYTMLTTISAGTLQIGNGGTTGSLATTGTILNNAALAFNRTNTVVQGTDFSSAAISGSGSLTVLGSGTVTLTATNTYTGNTTISAGALQIGSGGTTGSLALSSTITNNGSLRFNRTNAVAQGTDFSAAPITGSGSLVVAGSGTVTLNAANTYAGNTTISAGALQIGDGGTTGSLALSSTIANNGTLIFNRSNDLAQGTDFSAAPINGSGSLVKTGSGTLTLNAANAFSGAVTVNGGALILNYTADPNVGYTVYNASSFLIDTGTISLRSSQNALGMNNRPITIQNGGVLSADRVGGGGHAVGAVTLNGGNMAATNSNSFIPNSNFTVGGSALSTISAGLYLTSTPTFTVADAVAGSSTDLLVSGAITNTGGITKAGQGTMVLTNINSFSGALTVNGGTLILSDTTGAGGGTIGYAAYNASSYLIDSGTISLQTTQNGLGTANRPITIQNGGVLSGDRVGGGSHNLGAITLNGGNLAATNSNSFIPNSNFTVGGSALSTISAGLYLNNAVRTFDVADAVSGASTDLLVSGVISAGGVTKTGAGTMKLTAANSYSGTTGVTAGTLAVSGSLNGTTNVSVASGAILELDHGGLLNTSGSASVNGTLALKGASTVGKLSLANGSTLSTTISGTGAGNHGMVTVTGANNLSLNGSGSVTLSINSTGYTPVSGGGDLALSDRFALTLGGYTSGDAFSNVTLSYNAAYGQSLNSYTDPQGTQWAVFYGVNFNAGYSGGWQSGNDIALMVIPEPGTCVMLLSGCGFLVLRRRSRQFRG